MFLYSIHSHYPIMLFPPPVNQQQVFISSPRHKQQHHHHNTIIGTIVHLIQLNTIIYILLTF